MGFVNERIEIGKWQTIDRERGIVLKVEGNPGHSNNWRFHLTYPGENIYFRAHQKYQRVEGVIYIEWIILQIFASDHVKKDEAKLHNLIIEAMNSFGFVGVSKKESDRVTVTFDPNI